jgi:nicotinamide riboside transporter PnuC
LKKKEQESVMELVEIIAAVFSLIGIILNIKKIRWCFIIWLLSNTCWIIAGIMWHKYGVIITNGMFDVFNIYGFIEWGRNKDLEDSSK